MSKSYAPGQPAGEIDADGYVVIELDGVDYYAHDLAWLMVKGSLPKSPLVHINGILHDNRIANLRESAAT